MLLNTLTCLSPEQKGIVKGLLNELQSTNSIDELRHTRSRLTGIFDQTDSLPLKTVLAAVLGHHYGTYALYSDADTWLHRAGDLAEGSPELESYVGILKATTLMNRRQPYKAMQILDNLIRTHLPAAKQFECAALSAKAGLLSLTGNPDEANETYLKAIETSEARNDEYELLTAYHGYAHFCYRHEEYQTAVDYLQKTYSLAARLEITEIQCQTMVRLAEVYAKQGKADLARMKFGIAYADTNTRTAPMNRAFVLMTGLEVFLELEDYGMIRQLVLEMEQHLTLYPAPDLECNLKGFQAILLARANSFQQAEQLFRDAIAYNTDNFYPSGLGSWLYQLGVMYLKQKQYSDAVKVLDQAKEHLATAYINSLVIKSVEALADALTGAGAAPKQMEQLLVWTNSYSTQYANFVKKHISNINRLRQNEQTRSREEIFQLREVDLRDTNEKLTSAVNELTALATDKDEMLAIAASDIRSPLTKLNTMLHTLANTMADIPEYADQVQDVHSMLDLVHGMETIAGTFLNYSATLATSQTLENNTIDVAALIVKVVGRSSSLLKQKNLSITKTIPKTCKAFGNATLFTAIADNLLSNAIKHSPHSGTITVSLAISATADTTEEASPLAAGTRHQPPTAVLLTITDQGTGIPASEVSNLFTKYGRVSTTPTGGESSTGLGLYLSQKMAARMKAHLSYKPAEPTGSSFVLTMQAAQ